MKRIVITGATGFIGANLTGRLLKDGHQVNVLIRKDSDLWRLKQILPEIHLHEVEFGNQEGLGSVINKIRPEWVFHLAAHGAYSWQNEPEPILQTNIIGTANLVAACLKSGFEVFVNTGSSSEYGVKDHAASEDEYIEPNSYYAVAKASATLFCRYVSQGKKVNIPTLRIYSAYGPYEEPTRFVPRLIISGLEGRLPPLVNPDVSRDFVYIDDILEAYLLAATTKVKELGAVYNVGSGKSTSIREAVEIARDVLKIKAQPQWATMANRSWDTDIWIANIKKIENVLGWRPKYSFREGMENTVKWLLDHPQILEYYKKA